jgi:hypothetical protein
MKEAYTQPRLTVHGTIEQMTQLFGPSSASDSLIIGSLVFGPLPLGSEDLVIPWPPQK